MVAAVSAFGLRPEAPTEVGVWAISDTKLRWLLRRVADGEDPEMVYMEEVANAEHGPLREWLDRAER